MTENEDSMAVTLRRRRFTLDEYHRMGAGHTPRSSWLTVVAAILG